MKHLVVSLIFLICTLQTFSQQDYFIYLQADNQPFYVRLNNNVYSSSASGHLILSKQPDSVRHLTVGFAKNVFLEQDFNIPVNSKDGGYLLKNFGEKGWGLFNLQSLALIMNSNPGQEKKSPEISGTKKNDAFSLLLANAVNDTTILYTVSKPAKLAPALPVKVPDEKKNDTLIAAKQHLPEKDSTVTAKKIAAPLKDTIAAVTVLPKDKEKEAVAKNSPPARDTTAVIHNTPAPLTTAVIPKNTEVKNDINPAKNNSPAKKDTIIMMGTTASKKVKEPVVTKNNKERKDTIIMMPGRVIDSDNTAKSIPVKKEKMPTDTLQVKKEVLLPPEEKRNALMNNNPAVVIQKIPVEKDTTMAAAKNEPPGTADNKKDSLVSMPAKRLRPWVNKAAEVLTDTSYVAVFVDESKDKFDTIRISIPFNEAKMAISEKRPEPKELKRIDSIAAVQTPKDTSPSKTVTVVKDSVPATIMLDAVQAPARKDSPAAVPTDSGKIDKTASRPPSVNPDCKDVATDSDIDKLRVKMMLVVSDEDRISLAKKIYQQKCFLVKQARALSELFKTDEGKYKWFDAVYPFVQDSDNFSSLSEQLKDDYYLKRFKAMLRN